MLLAILSMPAIPVRWLSIAREPFYARYARTTEVAISSPVKMIGQKMQRIVSFSAVPPTEMVFALGLGDRLMGVSHECDYPPEAKSKPVVVRAVLPVESMSQSEIGCCGHRSDCEKV